MKKNAEHLKSASNVNKNAGHVQKNAAHVNKSAAVVNKNNAQEKKCFVMKIIMPHI